MVAPPGTSRAWMPALQSLRGIASLWVVLYHLDVYLFSQGQALLPIPGLRFGWLGVDLFFVLSAYLLGQPFFARQAPRARPFLVDRFLRVAPAYYVAFAASLTMVVAWRLEPWLPGRVLLNAAYLGNFDLQGIYAVNPVFWTLAVEMQFYLLLPWLCRGFMGRRWPWALAACVAASLLWRALLFGQETQPLPLPAWELDLPSELQPTTLATFTLPAFLGHFALGLAAARIGPLRAPVGSGVRRAVFLAGLPFIVVPPLVWIPAGSVAFGMESFAGQTLVRPLTALGFACIVLATASGGWPARVLALRPLAWLGSISYSLYLAHLLNLMWLGRVLPNGTPALAFGLAYVLASLLTGWLLHRGVEAPLEAWRRARKARAAP